MTGVSVLEREMYSEAEAARLLGVAQSTLNYWLEGGTRRGRVYRPVSGPSRGGIAYADIAHTLLERSVESPPADQWRVHASGTRRFMQFRDGQSA